MSSLDAVKTVETDVSIHELLSEALKLQLRPAECDVDDRRSSEAAMSMPSPSLLDVPSAQSVLEIPCTIRADLGECGSVDGKGLGETLNTASVVDRESDASGVPSSTTRRGKRPAGTSDSQREAAKRRKRARKAREQDTRDQGVIPPHKKSFPTMHSEPEPVVPRPELDAQLDFKRTKGAFTALPMEDAETKLHEFEELKMLGFLYLDWDGV